MRDLVQQLTGFVEPDRQLGIGVELQCFGVGLEFAYDMESGYGWTVGDDDDDADDDDDDDDDNDKEPEPEPESDDDDDDDDDEGCCG